MKKLIAFATIVLFVIFGLLPQTAAADYLVGLIDDWAMALGVGGVGIGTIVVISLIQFFKHKFGDKVGDYVTNKFESSPDSAEKFMRIMLDSPSAKQFIASKADLIADTKDRLKAEALQLKYEITTLTQKLALGILDKPSAKATQDLIAELQARYEEINA